MWVRRLLRTTPCASITPTARGLAFLVSAAGMSVVLVGITIVLALGQQTLVDRARAVAASIGKVSGRS